MALTVTVPYFLCFYDSSSVANTNYVYAGDDGRGCSIPLLYYYSTWRHNCIDGVFVQFLSAF